MATNRGDISKTLEGLNRFEVYEYATYIEGRTGGNASRRGDYRRHKTLVHARAAAKSAINVLVYDENGVVVGYRRPKTRIYRWSDEQGEWVEVAP